MEYDSLAAEYSKLQYSDSDGAHHKKDELDERRSKWRADVESLPGNLESLIWQRIDDRRAFRQDPPILLWDRREAEPLKVVEKDFFPHHEMCLLDFQPKSIWPVFKGKEISNYDYFDFMIAALFTNPTHSIVRGLKALAPGADEWIIPRCPSLTNTAKGGAIDLEQLPIRTLNQEMLRELTEAWMDWPFRPTKAEMMVRAGTRGNMPGDEDDFDPMTAGL
jgi:transcription factor 1